METSRSVRSQAFVQPELRLPRPSRLPRRCFGTLLLTLFATSIVFPQSGTPQPAGTFQNLPQNPSAPTPLPSANGNAQLTGALKDPAGYLIPHASVTLTPEPSATTPTLTPFTVQAGDQGLYLFEHLRPGAYTLTVAATGFAPLQQQILVAESSTPSHPQRLDLTLRLPAAEVQVNVSDQDASASSERNGSSIVLHAADLALLADDPDTMRTQLEAIAGPSPAGVTFFVDGFEAGRLPPKSEIREVRMNANLYSAQYDTSGQGRVEVFTRPGSGTLHGGVWISGADSASNAQDPFVAQPPYFTLQTGANLNGPLGKNLSSTVNFYRFTNDDSAIINATVLDSSLRPTPYVQAVPNARTQNFLSPRFDLQAPHDTALSLRYSFSYDTQAIGGVGSLSLASQAYRLVNTNQILQALVTNSLGAKSVNELRFQYTRTRNNQFAADPEPTLSVQGAFISGGAPGGTIRDNTDQYELQDYFSHVFKKSFLRAGGRLRSLRNSNFSNGNFNGGYTFPTLEAYRITLAGEAAGLSPAQIRAAGGGPSLFSITSGSPSVAVTRTDGAAYAEDDLKITPRLTASLGLRLESQTGISDHLDWAPRASLRYAFGKGKSHGFLSGFVLRAGGGLFYQRFTTANQLRIARQNGVLEQQYLVQNPDFYPYLPSTSQLGATMPSAVYSMSPGLRAPYDLYTGLGLDHPLGKSATLSVNFNSMHLMHAFELRNINAPIPGTYDPALNAGVPNGVRPLGGKEDVYQFGSDGVSNQQALRTTFSYRKGLFSVYAYYALAFNDADTNGSFPSNSYNQHADYGRSTNDLRHQFYGYLNATLPFKIESNTSFLAHSGLPFNIVLGQDINGDNQYNDRPTYATDLTRSSVVATRWGTFDIAPLPGQRTIPINLGTGPATVQFDQRLSRAFAVGRRLPAVPATAANPSAGAAAPQPTRRRFTLNFAVYASNLLNHVNLSPPNGTLNSPLFGRSTADQGARVLNFGTDFNF